MDKINQMLTSFHDYDIRGVYPTEIDEDFFYLLGKAIAAYVGKGPIGVGHDARISSPVLSEQLIKGITDAGLDVVFLGLVSTEIHYYASGTGKYEANVMVSASHNPKEFNGAKLCLKGAVPLHGGWGLPEIKALMTQEIPDAVQKGTVVNEDLFEAFIQNSISRFDLTSFKKMKVVIDAANGVGGPTWKRVMELLPSNVEIVPLYLEPDGTFPNHESDPMKDENIKDLQAKVLETGADFGIALDGDADRIFFVDEHAERISGTVTTAIIVDHFIRAEKRVGAYLYDVRVGRIVRDLVLKYGGTPVKTRVGHSFIKAEMRKHSGIFGGELSGHFYLQDHFNAECTLTCSLLFMKILSDRQKPLSEVAKEFDIYPQSGEINFSIQDKATTLQAIKDVFALNAESVEEIDGVNFNFKDWWFSVRFSNTAVPLLRLNLEADNQALMDEKLSEVIGVIESLGSVRK